MGQAVGRNDRSQGQADGRHGLDDAAAQPAAVTIPDLVKQDDPGAPLAADADAGKDAEDQERDEVPGKCREDGADSDQDQAGEQRVLAADLVAEETDQHAAQHRGGERH